MLPCSLFISFCTGRYSKLPAAHPHLENQLETGWKTIDVHVGVGISAESQQNEWKSHSQVHQDEVIHAMFPDGGHFFIDLAANDWRRISNSYSLETYDGWSGICIEPNERYWQGHLQRRCKLVGAAVGSKNELVLFKKSNGVDGGIVGENYDNQDNATAVEMYTVTLHEILRRNRAPKTVHYFSLDVEGAESVVFEHIPFDKYSVYVLTIERPTIDILQILTQEGYVEVGILGGFGDTMFLSRRTPNFYTVLERAQRKIMELVYPEHRGNSTALAPRRINTRPGTIRCPHTELNSCGSTLLHWKNGSKDV